MPSKGLTLLIVIFVVGSTYGLTLVDLSAPAGTPHYPPDYWSAQAPGPIGGGQPVAKVPGDPDGGTPNVEPGRQPDPEPEPEPEPTEEIRIKDLALTKLSADGTKQVLHPQTDDFVLLRIDKNGSPSWNGVALGDMAFVPQLLKKKVKEEKTIDLVIVPDKATPWKFVHMTLEEARLHGVTKLRIGGYPGYDEKKTLLTALDVHLLPKDTLAVLPEDMIDIVVEVKMAEDGEKATYVIFDKPADELGLVYSLASEYNSEYADEFGMAYTKDVAKTPWVVKAPGSMATGRVLVVADALRQAAIYTVRFAAPDDE